MPGTCFSPFGFASPVAIFETVLLTESPDDTGKPVSLMIKYRLKGYHLFKTKNIERLVRNEGFAIIKTVNEKQIFPKNRPIPNLLKIIRCSLTALVTVCTLGRVKIGTEITIYAAPAPPTEV